MYRTDKINDKNAQLSKIKQILLRNITFHLKETASPY